MANAGKIVIDADHGRMDSAADKSAKKYERIGKAASRVGKEVTVADKMTRQWQGSLQSGLLRILGIQTAMRAVIQSIKQARDASVQMSETAGASSLSRGASIRKLGLEKINGGIDQAMAATQAGGTGIRSQSEIDSFLSSMASSAKKKKIAPQNIMRALSAFQGGLFEQDELMGVVGSNRGLERLLMESQGRREGLSTAESKEIAARRKINEIRAQNGNESTNSAIRSRLSNEILKGQRTRNPIMYGLADAGTSVVSFGAVDGETLQQGMLDSGGSNAASLKALNQVVENTRSAVRPNGGTEPYEAPQ